MKCRRGLAMRILSVRLSAKRVISDKIEKKLVQIFTPYERSFILVFWEKKWLVGATASTWNFGSTDSRWSEIADFEPIIARSASAVTLAKKVELTLIGSPLRAFQWAMDDRRTLPLSPPKGVSKSKKADFRKKIALRLKNVCYKVQSFFVWKLSAAKL